MSPEDGASVTVSIERLGLIVTGSLSAAYLPYWAGWLHAAHPRTEVCTVVTRSALQFVTPTALAASTGGTVHVDDWRSAEQPAKALHVELAEWADAFLVYPASWHFLARLALGLADTPSLLALHCTKAPVLVAPSIPPGSLDSPVLRQHLDRLRQRPGYEVAAMRLGRSITTGRQEALLPSHFPDLIARLTALREPSSAVAETSVAPEPRAVPG